MALVLPRGAAGAGWRWPLRGPVVGAFHLSPRGALRARAAPGHRRVGAARRRRARRLRGARELRRPVPRRGLGGERALRCAGGDLPRPRAGSRSAPGRASPPAQRLGTLGAGRAPAARRAPRRRPPRLPRPAHACWRDDRPAPPAPRSGAACAAPASRRARARRRRRPRSRPRRPSRRAGCRGRPTPRWRSWPPRCPSAAWCGGAVAAATRSRIERRAAPLRAAGARLTPCNVRCPWPPSTPSTSPRRSTTSTRPRIWGTRTRRSPPTSWPATTASAARTCSS